MSNVTVNRGTTEGSSSDTGFKRIGQSERVVSLVAGTTLASSAMRSRSLVSAVILLGVSAGLIHRGATGRCGFSKGINQLNQMMNQGCEKMSGSSSSSSSSRKKDMITEASEESFPASDSPSFTPVTGESESRTHMNA